MARFKTTNEILNQIGVEIGLTKQSDVFASTDESYQRMVALCNSCLREMVETAPWQQLLREATITGNDILTHAGKVPLPEDFAYMVNQTGWERNQDVPLFGPLTAQEWTYLAGRDLVSYTIYASFRRARGQIWIFPWAESPPTVAPDADIHYEYISRNCVLTDGIQAFPRFQGIRHILCCGAVRTVVAVVGG